MDDKSSILIRHLNSLNANVKGMYVVNVSDAIFMTLYAYISNYGPSQGVGGFCF